MIRVMQHGIRRGHKLVCRRAVIGSYVSRRAIVQVAVKAREIAARNLQPQYVSFLEDVARRPQINREFVNLPRRHHLRLLSRIAITRADNSLS